MALGLAAAVGVVPGPAPDTEGALETAPTPGPEGAREAVVAPGREGAREVAAAAAAVQGARALVVTRGGCDGRRI